MKRNDWFFILLMVVVCASLVVQCYHPTTLTERTKVLYDCRIAEISPDYPQAVKEECRIMMKE